MKLTEKQKRFCDYYIETGIAETSAKKAGYSARGNTTKLLQNTTIKKYIDKRLKQLESDKIANQDEILRYLTKVMRREEKEYQTVKVKKKKTYFKDGKKETSEEEEVQIIEIPSKLSDSNKAAELLGKRYVLWTDSINHNGEVNINNPYKDLTTEELKKLIKNDK